MANRQRNRNYGRDYGRGENRRDYRNRFADRRRSGSDEDRDNLGGYSLDRSDSDRDDRLFGGNLRYGEGHVVGGDVEHYSILNPEENEEYERYQQRPRRTGRGRSDDYNRESSRVGGYYGRSGGYDDRYDERDYDRGYSSAYEQDERGWWDKTSDEVASWFGDEEAEQRREMDARHRGRGPRNYQRSDERIREDINDRLTDDDYLDASDIEVEVSNREVVLTGTVDSRYAKRLAEDIAEDVSGVTNVENRIRVNRSFYNQGGSSYAQTPAPEKTTTREMNETTTTGKSRGKTA